VVTVTAPQLNDLVLTFTIYHLCDGWA